jgi:hypothetical protein
MHFEDLAPFFVLKTERHGARDAAEVESTLWVETTIL